MSQPPTSKILPFRREKMVVKCNSAGQSTGQKTIGEQPLLKTKGHTQRSLAGHPLTPLKKFSEVAFLATGGRFDVLLDSDIIKQYPLIFQDCIEELLKCCYERGNVCMDKLQRCQKGKTCLFEALMLEQMCSYLNNRTIASFFMRRRQAVRILTTAPFSIRRSSHGKAIVPFNLCSNFWNGQIGCSHGNKMLAYQLCFVFRQERNRFADIFSNCLFEMRNGTERLPIVPLFVSLFSRSIFWNGTVLFEAFPSEHNPSAFHFSEQYVRKWNDCAPM